MSADRVERVSQLVRDGARELAESRQALLGGEVAPRRDEQFVQLLERAVLGGQLGGRVLDLPPQLRVESANLRQHAIESARQVRKLVAALRGTGSADVVLPVLHGAHRRREPIHPAHEDAAQQDPEGADEKEARRDRGGEQRPALRRDEPLRLGERGDEHQPRPRSAAVGERLRPAQRPALLRFVDDRGGARQMRERPAPPRQQDSLGRDAGRNKVGIDPQRCRARQLRSQQAAVHPDRGRQLFGDLLVVRACPPQRGGRRTSQLDGAIPHLGLDGPLRDAQPESGGDEQGGGEHRREQRDELEPQGHCGSDGTPERRPERVSCRRALLRSCAWRRKLFLLLLLVVS